MSDLTPTTDSVSSSEWIASAVAAVPTRDENGALLAGRALLICDGIKELMRVIAVWQVAGNTTLLPWSYMPQYYRNETHSAVIVVCHLRHEDETHSFKMEADWEANTTTAEKIDYCNCPPPERMSTNA